MNTRSRTPLVVAAVIVVVAVAGILAVVLTRDSDDDETSGTTTPPTTSADGGEIVYGTVEVVGTPLPEFAGDPDPAVGAVAPALVGETYGGAPMEITPGEDGPMMIVFLAHWCPHCNEEVPVLLEWRDSGAIPDDLQIVGVSTAVSEERPNFPPAQWLADKGWEWPTMADDAESTALAAYGGAGFPYFVVVGEDGTVKARNAGVLPEEELDALVTAALA